MLRWFHLGSQWGKAVGLVLVVLVCFPFLVSARNSVIQGKIVEVHPHQKWLSIDSDQGFLFLVLHPQGFVFKDGRKSSLSSFHPGDMIAAVPGGIGKKNTVLILALEDWKTYAVEAHLVSAALRIKVLKSSTSRPLPAAAKFQQMNGRIFDLQPSLKMFLIRTPRGENRVIWVGKQTKIYTFEKHEFILYHFHSLLKGQWVEVGGFPIRNGIKAESVYIY